MRCEARRRNNVMPSIFTTDGAAAVPIWFVTAASYPEVRERLSAAVRAFADAAGFETEARSLPRIARGGRPGRHPVRTRKRRRRQGLVSARDGCRSNCPAAFTASPTIRMTRGSLSLAFAVGEPIALRATTSPKAARSSSICRRASIARICERVVEAVTLVRDLINTPANDMGPGRARRRGARGGDATRRPRQRDRR